MFYLQYIVCANTSNHCSGYPPPPPHKHSEISVIYYHPSNPIFN